MSCCYQYKTNCRYNNYGQGSNSFQQSPNFSGNNSGNFGSGTRPNSNSNTASFNRSGQYGQGNRFGNGNINNLSSQEELPVRLSDSLALRKSPERKTLSKSMMQIEENCCEVLKILVDIETEAEKQKIENFVKVKDFNVDDVFLFFETENSQDDTLSPQDIKEGFNKIGLDFTDGDVKFLLNKFDLVNDGGLSFTNLFDMLVPFDKRSRDEVESRNPTGNMSEQVVGGLKNYIDFVFDSEKKLDDIRKKVLENKKFDPVKFFQEEIDVNGTGYITIQDFEKFLQSKGIIQNSKEADLVFIRMDRNRDGKVAIDEFTNEFTPLETKLN